MSVLGQVEKKKISYRNANINDLVVVTGDLGLQKYQLQILKEKKKYSCQTQVFNQTCKEMIILQRQLKTKLRFNFCKSFRRFRHYTNVYDRYIGWTNI